MPELTVQTISLTGLAPTFAAAGSEGDTFNNDGRTFFYIKNGDASEHTATIDSLVDCDQGVDHDPAVAILAGEERLIGPFTKGRFNSASEQVSISYDAIASITVAAIRF